jgi:hypothetical protein
MKIGDKTGKIEEKEQILVTGITYGQFAELRRGAFIRYYYNILASDQTSILRQGADISIGYQYRESNKSTYI